MTAVAHALVAGAIATKVHDPISLVTLNLGAHFIMDSVPHWDFGTNWRSRSKRLTGFISIIDTLTAYAVAYLLFIPQTTGFLLILAVTSSLLPDWLETPWYIFFARNDKFEPGKHASFLEKLTFRLYKTENRFHSKAGFPLGAITQVATVLFFLWVLK